MADDDELPSYDELVEKLVEYEDLIRIKDDEIEQLTKETVGRGRKGKGGAVTSGGDDYSSLEAELKELRSQQELDKKTISKLREDIAVATNSVDEVSRTKNKLEAELKAKQKTIESLEKENKDLQKRTQSIETQTKEINKQKSANVKISQQLSDENEALREESDRLKEEIKKITAEKQAMADVLVKVDEQKERMESDRNNLDVEKGDLIREIEELQRDLDEALERYQVLEESEAKWEQKYEATQKELQSIQSKVAQEQSQAKAETESLKNQVNQLKETTKVGQLQKKYDDLLVKSSQDAKLIEDLQDELEKVMSDIDILSKQVEDMDQNIDQKVANKIAAERQKVKNLESTIERMKKDNHGESEHYKQLEKEKTDLVKQVDELTNWKAIYEAGHGLHQLSRNQKKLSDDNRRLTKALEEQTNRVGMLMDANNALSLSFDRLKKECGKPADFKYADLELYNEIQSTTYALQMQVKELEEQLSTLENTNSRLRKAMVEHATSVSEKGFKYTGLNPDQLVLVNEFAANLRDGKVELPLDDRSKVLLAENKKLKQETQVWKEKVDRMENDFSGGNGTHGIISDTFGSDIKTLLHENADMQQRMQLLQTQLDELLHKQSENGVIRVDDLSSILTQNNELVLKELEELRRSQPNGGMMMMPHLSIAEGSSSLPPSGRIRQSQQQQAPPSTIVKREPMKSTPAKSGKLMLDLTPARPVMSEVPQSHQQQQRLQPGGTPFWTPQMNQGGMPFANTMGSTYFPMTPGSQLGTLGPNTPHGKQLLNNTLYNLNLPPEEWTSDVKELSSQLIECLEQLYERENELEEQRGVIKTFEETLGEMKIQMVALYHDYAIRKQQWDGKEKQLKEEHKSVNEERDDLRTKVRRMQEMVETLQREDKESTEAKLTEMTRKVIIYEVNESILSRKFMSVSEQLDVETKRRIQLQQDFTEMESSLKQRILFLEQYKLAAGSRIAYIQGKVDQMIPQDDYMSLQHEMDSLREDHLNTLRREVEARISALKALDRARELRSLRIVLSHVTADLEKSKAFSMKLEMELAHERDSTNKALAAMKSSAEVASIVTEMANYRGEASRLEVEVVAANKRNELLNKNIQDITIEVEALSNRVKELEAREEDYSAKESAARKELLDLKLQYEGGLTRDAKDQLQHRSEKCQLDLDEANREINRQKELVDIAMLQVQSLTQFKQSYLEEMKELREYCSRLESRSDDEVLIGRLQRQLMSTKASYKAFVRKYQSTRETMRKREITARVLEAKLMEMERSHVEALEKRHVELSSLKKALRDVKSSIVQSNVPISSASAGFSAVTSSNNDQIPADVRESLSMLSAAKKRHLPAGLRNKNNKGTKYFTVGLGAKLVEISYKVDTLAELAEDSVARAAEKEEESRKLSADVEDLQSEKANLLQRIRDLEVLHAGGSSKQQAIAARLISLSEESRVHKLTNLQQRRQILTMREEVKHLRSVIVKIEENSVELEKGKVDSEASKAQSVLVDASGTDLLADMDKLLSAEDDRVDKSFSKGRLSIDTNLHLHPHDDDEGVPDEVLQEYETRIVQLNDQLTLLRKDLSNATLKLNNMEGRSSDLETTLQEKEDQLAYYEKVLSEENLQRVILRVRQGVPPSARKSHPNSPVRSSQHKIMPEEQEKLQEAASATIGSLKSLLEEKNRLLERYREKLDHILGQQSTRTRAEKRADDLLDRLGIDEERAYIDRIPDTIRINNPAMDGSHRKLMEQLEKADEIIAEKEKNIHALEQSLIQQTHQRERAEVRCGDTLKEMDAMKDDMVTLVRQLQDSEERCRHLAHSMHVQVHHSSPSPKKEVAPPAGNTVMTVEYRAEQRKVKDLEKAVKQKEEKIKGYREIIVKLKEEFIKSEEEKAAREVETKYRSEQSSAAISPEELKDLKGKVTDLHEGLKSAKQDLERAKKVREKLTDEKAVLVEDVKKLEEQLHKTESQLASAQNLINKHRRDLEESKRKEVKLREKLKEFLQNGNVAAEHSTSAKGAKDAMSKYKEKVDEMKAEMDLLKAQNAALRRAEGVDNMIESDLKELRFNATGGHGEGGKSSTGYILGGGDASNDELRQQLHAKWEAEKKLQKRVGIMEKRMHELVEENNDLKQQVLRARDNLQTQLVKEETSRKTHGATKGGDHGATQSGKKAGGAVTAGELNELADAQTKIFLLEDRIQSLTRKAEVEQTNQIRQLNHQLSIGQGRIQELERIVGESEEKSKKSSHFDGGRGGLRDSEDRFMRNERMKDELDFLRRQKLELEAALLDKDSKALESQFDLETAEIDIQRLRRRVGELDQMNRALRMMTPATAGGAGAGDATGSKFYHRDDAMMSGVSGTKREMELETVVENLRRVVEKVRGENDRLRRGIGTDDAHDTSAVGGNKKPVDAGLEKKFLAEKKKNEKLTEEITALKTKMQIGEDSAQKLVMKQQQIATLRKQLKTKEDECNAQLQETQKLAQDREDLRKKLKIFEDRIRELEDATQQSSSQRPGANNISAKESDDLRKKLSIAQAENDILKADMTELRRKLNNNTRDATSLAGSVAGNAPMLQAEVGRLRQENDKLRQELSAFDLDFFEEIENLKFAHAEAIQKLRMYEKQQPRR